MGNKITFNISSGGLGRAALGQDYVSGMVFYNNSLPSGFTSNANILKFGSINDAINAGININYGGETKAIFKFQVTLGATGDVITVNFTEPGSSVVQLCKYTVLATDTTSAILATSIANAISTNISNGGYKAAESTGGGNFFVNITVRPGLGVYPNTGTPLVNTVVGSTTLGSVSETTTGVADVLAVYYYHINRFFTQNPGSTLYVGIFGVPSWSGYNFVEIYTMQKFAQGALRQIGMYINDATGGTNASLHSYITAMQGQVATLISQKQPLSVFIGADLHSMTAAAFTDLSTLNSEHVSVVIGQDGAALGFALYNAYALSITNLGDVLGIVSRAQVNWDISWSQQFNLAIDGVENVIPAFATGELLSNLSSGTISSIDAFRFLFGHIFINNNPAGTFMNDSHTCTAYTSDFAYIENVRTYDKALRNLNAAYLGPLGSPITLQSNGTLTNASVAYFEGVGETVLNAMTSGNPNSGLPELSAYSVAISPSQDVLATSNILVTISMIPTGSARTITINLSFAASIAS